MTDYDLRVSSYEGIVAGARHYRGRVTGPSPTPCHGNVTRFNAPQARGKVTCDQGHELPGRAEWEVEASWSRDRYERWAAKEFAGDGPSQFASEAAVLVAAAARFDGTWLPRFWEDTPVVGSPGDRLLYHGDVLYEVPGKVLAVTDGKPG